MLPVLSPFTAARQLRPCRAVAVAVAVAAATAAPASAAPASSAAPAPPGSYLEFLERDAVRATLVLLDEERRREAGARIDSIVASLPLGTPAESLAWARWVDLGLRVHVGSDTASLERARSLLALRARLAGDASDDAASARHSVGRALLRFSRYEEARVLLDEAVAVADRRWGPGHPRSAPFLIGLAFAEYRLYRRADAVRHAERAVAVLEGRDPSYDLALCIALETLAAFLPREQVGRGVALAERALSIRQRHGPHPGLWRAWTSMASLRTDLGDYVEVYRLTSLAVETLRREGGDPLTLSTMVSNVGMAAMVLGEYGESVRLQDEAIGLSRSAPDHFFRAWAYARRGEAQGALGDAAAAIASLDTALAIDARAGDASSAIWMRSLRAQQLHALGRTAEAVEQCERTVERIDSLRRTRGDIQLGRNSCTVLDLLGQIRAEEGRDDEAGRLFRQAADEMLRDRGRVPAVAAPLHRLAAHRHRRGELDSAAALYDEVLGILAVLGRQHPMVAEVRADRGRLIARQGRLGAAFDELLEAEAIARRHLQLLFRSLAERQALRYAARRRSALDPALWIACETDSAPAGGVRRLWDEVVRSRALVLDEIAKRRRLLAADTDSAVVALRTAYATTRRRLAHLVIQGPGAPGAEVHRDLVERVRAEGDDLEQRMAAASREFQRLHELDPPDFARVAAALPRGSALVAYVRYETPGLEVMPWAAAPGRGPGGAADSAYAAFVLEHPGAEPAIVPLGSARSLDSLVAAWRNALAGSGPRNDRDALGDRLRRRLWDPVADRLRGATSVHLVPDGSVHFVPFEALPVRGGVLLERGPALRRLNAERDLVSAARRQPAAGALLAFGGVDFDRPGRDQFAARPRAVPAGGSVPRALRSPTPACLGSGGLRFAALPGSHRELGAIRASRGAAGGLFVSGAEASEPIFKRFAPLHGTLHLATHAFGLAERCESAGGARDEPQPLLGCGVALAGANLARAAGEDREDGVLTAEEIASLDLGRVDLVVLSACESAGGRVAVREGILGLQRAFRIAGAGHLVLSLWPVEDAAAAAWMAEFYRARGRGAGAAEAARRAASALIERARARGEPPSPAAWAAFVVVE